MFVRALYFLCMLLLTAGVAACGSGDGNGNDAEDEIRDLVETFYGNEEGVCDVISAKLLRDQFESKEACEKAAAGAEPEEGYEIEDVSVDGDEGEVSVKVDDQSGTLLVTREDGDWKVDGIKQDELEPETTTGPAE